MVALPLTLTSRTNVRFGILPKDSSVQRWEGGNKCEPGRCPCQGFDYFLTNRRATQETRVFVGLLQKEGWSVTVQAATVY